jgi:hypothetical protein
MKRSVSWLGAAALVSTLVVGCARRGREAQAPEQGPASPTFESNVPSGAPTSPTPGANPEQPLPTPGQEQATPPPAPGPGAGAAPGPGAGPSAPAAPPPGPEQPSPAAAAGESERQLCETLSGTAKLHVEDVKGGVAIVISPKPGQDLATLRDEAHRMQTMIRQHAGGEGAAGCGLFAIARLPNITSSVTEGQKDVRIVLHTSNPAELKDLRRATRQEVQVISPKAR